MPNVRSISVVHNFIPTVKSLDSIFFPVALFFFFFKYSVTETPCRIFFFLNNDTNKLSICLVKTFKASKQRMRIIALKQSSVLLRQIFFNKLGTV
jgi:hypothetical protein